MGVLRNSTTIIGRAIVYDSDGLDKKAHGYDNAAGAC